jgi:hypothetical protein
LIGAVTAAGEALTVGRVGSFGSGIKRRLGLGRVLAAG